MEHSGASVLVHGHSRRPSAGRIIFKGFGVSTLEGLQQKNTSKKSGMFISRPVDSFSFSIFSSPLTSPTQVDGWNKQSSLPYRVLPGDHILEVNDISISDLVI